MRASNRSKLAQDGWPALSSLNPSMLWVALPLAACCERVEIGNEAVEMQLSAISYHYQENQKLAIH